MSDLRDLHTADGLKQAVKALEKPIARRLWKTVIPVVGLVVLLNLVVFLALFGSFAHGRQTVRSDVDLLVKFDKTKDKSLLDLIRAEREMKKVFHRKVDLVTEKSLSPYLRKSVLNSLRVIYER